MRVFEVAGGMVVVALAAALGGCAVHAQAPIKEVAYDFSDYGYYDRPFGASPSYPSNEEPAHEAKAKTAADDMVAFPCNKALEGDEEVTCYFHHKRGNGGPTESDVRIETEGSDAHAPAATNTRPPTAAPQTPPAVAQQAPPAPAAQPAPPPAGRAPGIATR